MEEGIGHRASVGGIGEGACWAWASAWLNTHGLDVPSTPEEALAKGRAIGVSIGKVLPRRGDLVLMKSPRDGHHVGVCVDPFRVSHFDKGRVRTDWLSMLRRGYAGNVVVVRLETKPAESGR